MKNKYFLISLLIWLGTFKTYSQSCEIFANNDHEIISICNDTIAYRLKNNGGVETFSYSIGKVKIKRKKMNISHTPFAFAYSESKAALKNVAIVILLDNDLNPIRNASIRTKINKEEMFFFSNEQGQINIPDLIVNRTLTFEVLALGNTFQHTMELKEKTLNKIILKVPSELGISNSLASYRKCLKIKRSNDDTIEVYDPVTKTWKIFTRRKINIFFTDVISHLFSVE